MQALGRAEVARSTHTMWPSANPTERASMTTGTVCDPSPAAEGDGNGGFADRLARPPCLSKARLDHKCSAKSPLPVASDRDHNLARCALLALECGSKVANGTLYPTHCKEPKSGRDVYGRERVERAGA
eukprot:scaffold204792_cov34-Tisochrysis_lutea.AAC.1